jgi:hypothetical protein
MEEVVEEPKCAEPAITSNSEGELPRNAAVITRLPNALCREITRTMNDRIVASQELRDKVDGHTAREIRKSDNAVSITTCWFCYWPPQTPRPAAFPARSATRR